MTKKIKIEKILFIADLVHAQPRIPTLAKYFNNNGIETHILSYSPADSARHTIENINNNRVIEFLKFLKNNNSIFRSLFGIISFLLKYPDSHYRKWYKNGLLECERVVKEFKPDLIVSSSSPITAHLIARKVSKINKIKWCADFRDLWSLNHNHQGGFIGKHMDAILEKRVIRDADIIVTVTPDWKDTLTAFYNREVYCISNGFDDNLYNGFNKKINQHSEFTITYTGNIYKESQESNLKNLIYALKSNNNNIKFNIIGPRDHWILKTIQEHSAENFVTLIPPVNQSQIAKIQENSDVNVLFGWNNKQGIGWYPLKMFEYIGAKRPILYINGDEFGEHAALKLLQKFSFCSAAASINQIKQAVDHAIINQDNFKLSNDDKINVYNLSFSVLANKYIKILNKDFK